MPGELKAQWNGLMAQQAHQRWLNAIDERIARFQEHCRRKEGQQVRWFMVRHNAALQADAAEFDYRVREVLNEHLTKVDVRNLPHWVRRRV